MVFKYSKLRKITMPNFSETKQRNTLSDQDHYVTGSFKVEGNKSSICMHLGT